MSVWKKLEHLGKTTGIWECGTKVGRPMDTPRGHQQKNWDFSLRHNRRFGRGFYAALNRMSESEYKTIILSLVKKKEKSRHRGEGLTEKQWRYLGALMTKADPGCVENPRVVIKKQNRKTESKREPAPVILRKKRESVVK